MAKKKKSWRAGYDADQIIQRVRPREISDYLGNPHRGTTTFQRFQGDALYPDIHWRDTYGPVTFKPAPKKLRPNKRYTPWTTLAYCRWPWRWLEPTKGKFNWKIIDGALKAAKDRGQTLQVRFQPFTEERVIPEEQIKCKRRPKGVSVDVPDWYWDTGARWVQYGKRGDFEPDHNDPLYAKHFGAFIRAFAKRYDGHPVLESIDVAYAGHWGESGGNSNADTARKLVDIYVRSFKKTQLLSMLSTDGCKYASTLNKAIGWRADCYGDMRANGRGMVPDNANWNHMFDAYPSGIWEYGVQDAWKTAPVTFETCGTVASWHLHKFDIDWIIEQGYKYHISVFMPKSVYFPDEWMDKVLAFEKRIGYRFVLRQLLMPLESAPGKRIELQLSIDNAGCAPIYRPYKLAVKFTQGKKTRIVTLKKDIRTWMPDITWFKERITVPADLKAGTVDVAVGIVNDKNKPVVRFAIKTVDKDGWHPMTKLDLVK